MNELIFKRIENIDINYKHPSYYLEKKLIRQIELGLESDAYVTLNTINALERAYLSDNPVRSLKFSLISSCALFSRAAIESHVSPEDAFSQADICILHIDKLDNIKDLTDYEYTMVQIFIHMIIKERTNLYSKYVSQVIKYVHKNITNKISLRDLENKTGKSKEYLATIFKKEVGYTILEYIQMAKIESSKQFLEFTTAPIVEIAEMFNFSNASHYTKVFKKHVAITPSKYRMSLKF